MRLDRLASSTVAAVAISLALPAVVPAQVASPDRQSTLRVVAHSTAMSRRGAALTFELSNGSTVKVSLVGGEIRVNDRAVGRYERGGDLEDSWQRLVSTAGQRDPAEMLDAVKDWDSSGLTLAERQAFAKIVQPFSQLTAASVVQARDVSETLSPTRSALDALNGALEDQLAQLDQLNGVELETLRQQIQDQVRAARATARAATRQALRAESRVRQQPSVVSRVGTDIASLLAAFIGLGAMGIGLALFGPRQLEIVADTVRQSFWRSFATGFLAQPLILPLLGALILGLILTVIGILVIPFAIIAFLVATGLAVIVGYLAVARSVGEMYLRNKMSHGISVGAWLPHRYVLYGLGALLAIWIPAVLFGWVPIAGDIAFASAVILTWMLATAGFGATILSRAGIRGTFTRQFDRALTDEYLYEPSLETPAVRVPTRSSRRRR
ncbi:MAG: hypothetical protein ACE5HT_05835 [Gemmatimonadales bacterium]